MKPTLLKNVKKGEYFTLTNKVKLNEDGEVLSKYVRVKGEYVRNIQKYEVYKHDNICDYAFMKGERIVYIDFRF